MAEHLDDPIRQTHEKREREQRAVKQIHARKGHFTCGDQRGAEGMHFSAKLACG